MSVPPWSIPIVICPGFHARAWTDRFLQGMRFPNPDSLWVFPAEEYPACSGVHIFNFLYEISSGSVRSNTASIDAQITERNGLGITPILIGFSAGVVGVMQAAWVWRQLGGDIAAIIAIDGWGVPLLSDIPCYRLSHDRFTHWSSAVLGRGCDRFYADPSMAHSELWQSPQNAQGWWICDHESQSDPKTATTAADFIHHLLIRHGAISP
ncbi:MAG: hypothetical protein ACFCU8_19050 [Thermosynechococcaceae cyanobacterium]